MLMRDLILRFFQPLREGEGEGGGGGGGDDAPPAPAAFDIGSIEDEGLRGWAENKGFKDPVDFLKAAHGAEKKLGIPADRILRIPDADDAEGMAAIYDKLGRPQDAAGYEIKAPEGSAPDFADKMSAAMHELGLSKAQAQGLAKIYGEVAASQGEQTSEATAAQLEADKAALKTEWGAAHDERMGNAKRLIREAGIDGETLDKVEAEVGFTNTMRLIGHLADKLGAETAEPNGEGQGSGAMTPAMAKAKIDELKADPQFAALYRNGDKAAKARMETLYKFAYPGEAA